MCRNNNNNNYYYHLGNIARKGTRVVLSHFPRAYVYIILRFATFTGRSAVGTHVIKYFARVSLSKHVCAHTGRDGKKFVRNSPRTAARQWNT